MAQLVQVTIERGDITTFDADVIVLKFAQSQHGADRLVANQLISRGILACDLTPHGATPSDRRRYVPN